MSAQKACMDCPDHFFSEAAGLAVCTPCPAGYLSGPTAVGLDGYEYI
jgi:hypothetical protein